MKAMADGERDGEVPMRLEHRIILDWVDPESTVLELGCGDGTLLALLVNEKRVRAQGIEIDANAVRECVEKGLSVFQEDIESGLSEYPDKSFDYLILDQSLQQVKRPDSILKEAMRVGRRLIVGFPNFAYYTVRLQILFGGKVPVTPALPHEWYDTPNLHFMSISNFIEYCRKRNFKIEDSVFVRKNKKASVFPNLFAELGVFLISQ
jgi:methionine biosynthesis protein MetW